MKVLWVYAAALMVPWSMPQAARSADPDQVVAEARQRAGRLAEAAVAMLADGSDRDAREACGRLSFAHELERAAARVAGNSSPTSAAESHQRLIEQLRQLATLAEARANIGVASNGDVAICRFHLGRARSQAARLRGDLGEARRQFDEAVAEAERVADHSQQLWETGSATLRIDDILLPLRAKAERAALFSLDQRPFISQLVDTSKQLLERSKAMVEAGGETRSALLYAQCLSELASADQQVVNGGAPDEPLRAAAKSAEELEQATAGDSKLVEELQAIRLRRDIEFRLAAAEQDPKALARCLAGVNRRAAELQAKATAQHVAGVGSSADAVLIDGFASWAALERLVPERAQRVMPVTGDHPGSTRFRLWDRSWYVLGERVYCHEQGKWSLLPNE